MTSIYNYQKHITDLRTIEMALPDDGATELATIDGITYVSVQESADLPDQPSELTITETLLTDELKQEISKRSPHVRLINERVVERIRERYTENDELKFARLAWSDVKTAEDQAELDAYDAHVESARLWGRDQKALLGL